MKRRKKASPRPKPRPKRSAQPDIPPAPFADRPEPPDEQRQAQYDIERDLVPREVGPHEVLVDPRLEH